MTLIGCWRFTGTPTQNGVVTAGNNETTPLRPDSLLGGFTKPSESRISETTILQAPVCGATVWIVWRQSRWSAGWSSQLMVLIRPFQVVLQHTPFSERHGFYDFRSADSTNAVPPPASCVVTAAAIKECRMEANSGSSSRARQV